MKPTKPIKGFLLSVSIIISILFTSCSINFDNSSQKEKDSSDISSSIDSSSAEQSNNKYCFWEVTSENSDGKLYLFGSIHAADKSAYPLTDVVMNAYNECESIAVECDIVAFEKDLTAQIEMSTDMVYTDGTKISDHLDNEIYEGLKKILVDNKSYMSAYDTFKPAMWMSLADVIVLEKAGLDEKRGLDRYFLKKATTDKKEILEIESIEFQTQMLMGFSDELMNIMLKSYIEDLDLQAEMLSELYDSWRAGDTEKLYTIGSGEEDELTEAEKILIEDYNKQMLTDRNNGMVDKAEQYLSEGRKVFYIVGAMHMVGDDGIVEQLEAKGYTVTRL